jgi:hypothetical protein
LQGSVADRLCLSLFRLYGGKKVERKIGKATVMIAVLLLSMASMANASIRKIGETVRVGTESVDWWPMFRHDLNHTAYSTSTAPNTNNTIWSYTTGRWVVSSPAVADGKVYVGSWDGKVYAFGPSELIHDVAIVNIAPSKTVVGQGYNMNVNVTVANQGEYTETFNVTLYAGTPINETGLVGYWNFDEGAGTIAHDSSGNNNDGTIYGATWTSGKIGNALQFDGIDDSVRIPDSASLNIAGDKISITAWVKRLGSGTRNGIIVMKQAPPGAWDASYGVVISEGVINTGKIGLSLDTGWGWTDHWSNSVLNSNEWYHFCGTYDGSKVKIYLNGILDAEYDVTGNIVPKSGPLSIGHEDAWDPEYFNGLIDEVKVYNRSLSAEEVWAEYTRTGGRFAIGTQTVTLESGASTTLTFTWNTAGFAKGNYTIWAYAWPVPGEIEITDNSLTDGFVIVSMVGDVTGPNGWPDGKIDMLDVGTVARAFGSYPGHPWWNPNADINNDLYVDVFDLIRVVLKFGKTDP